jgi:hypothetical protein
MLPLLSLLAAKWTIESLPGLQQASEAQQRR